MDTGQLERVTARRTQMSFWPMQYSLASIARRARLSCGTELYALPGLRHAHISQTFPKNHRADGPINRQLLSENAPTFSIS